MQRRSSGRDHFFDSFSAEMDTKPPESPKNSADIPVFVKLMMLDTYDNNRCWPNFRRKAWCAAQNTHLTVGIA
jgi:hypothetical protein